jgi:hypothetical protein
MFQVIQTRRRLHLHCPGRNCYLRNYFHQKLYNNMTTTHTIATMANPGHHVDSQYTHSSTVNTLHFIDENVTGSDIFPGGGSNSSFPKEFSRRRAYVPPPAWLIEAVGTLDQYGVPTMLAVGIVLNLLVTSTILNTKLKTVPTCLFFASLGVVDQIYLVAMIIPWASTRVVDIYNMEGFCQMVYYCNLLTTFLSSWYVVLLLWERTMVLYSEDHAKKHCSPFKIKCVLITLSIFSFVGHLYLTWTSAVLPMRTPRGIMRTCTVIPENTQNIMVLRKVEIVFSFVLPVTAAVLFSLMIVAKLILMGGCFKGEHRGFTSVATRNTRINGRPQNTRKDTLARYCCHRSEIDVPTFTKSAMLSATCLVVSVLFLVLSLPPYVIKARLTFMDGPVAFTWTDALWLKLFEELYKINFAYKGLVYFILLPEMRWSLVDMFKCKSCKRRRESGSGEMNDIDV